MFHANQRLIGLKVSSLSVELRREKNSLTDMHKIPEKTISDFA